MKPSELEVANPWIVFPAKLPNLIVGENPGSKLAKAEKLGVKVITAAQFEAMLAETPPDQISSSLNKFQSPFWPDKGETSKTENKCRRI